MSAPEHPTSGSPAARRHPGVTVLLIVAGVVLLFPGLCSLFVIFALFGDDVRDALNDGGLVALWTVCLAISAGGILLIRQAWKRRRTAA
jgi:uncharacterized membrane protein YjjB (DUF3815 family)